MLKNFTNKLASKATEDVMDVLSTAGGFSKHEIENTVAQI